MSGFSGYELTKKRKEVGLSQAKLAKQLGISRNYLSQLERGEQRNISHSLYTRILLFMNDVPQAEQPAKLDEISGKLGGIADQLDRVIDLLRAFYMEKR